MISHNIPGCLSIDHHRSGYPQEILRMSQDVSGYHGIKKKKQKQGYTL